MWILVYTGSFAPRTPSLFFLETHEHRHVLLLLAILKPFQALSPLFKKLKKGAGFCCIQELILY